MRGDFDTGLAHTMQLRQLQSRWEIDYRRASLDGVALPRAAARVKHAGTGHSTCNARFGPGLQAKKMGWQLAQPFETIGGEGDSNPRCAINARLISSQGSPISVPTPTTGSRAAPAPRR